MNARRYLAKFLGTDLARKHPLGIVIALLLLSVLGGAVVSVAPVYVLPLMFLAIVGLLLGLLYTEYAFALIPLILTVRELSLVSIPALASMAGSVDIRLAELAIALFSLLYILRLTVGHSKLFLTKETKYMLFLGLWIVISWLWSPYPTKAILLSMRLLLGIGSLLLCVNILVKKEDLSRIVLVWVATATVIAILVLIEFQVKGASVFETTSLSRIGGAGGRARSFFGHPNLLAPYLNYGFVLTLGVWRAVSRPKGVVLVLSLALALIFLALLTTLSRGAWVAFAAGVTTFGLLSKKKWRYAAFISVLILLTLVSIILIRPYFVQVLSTRLVSITDLEEDVAIRGRFILWNAAIRVVGEHVLWGVGLGTFGEVVGRYVDDFPKADLPSFAHNNYVQMLVALGLIGLTLYISALGRVLVKLHSIYQSASAPFSKQMSLSMLAGLAMFAVNNIFTNDLFEIQNWMFMGLCMSMINIPQATFDVRK